MKKEDDIKIIRNYSFLSHPIKYIKDIRKIHLMQIYHNHMWNNGLREEVERVQMDILKHGVAYFKDGKSISYEKVKKIGEDF